MSENRQYSAPSVGQIMRTDPVTIHATSTVRDAVNVMSRNGIRHLVVVSPMGNVIGLLSQRDIFRHLSESGNRNSIVGNVMTTPVVSTQPDVPADEAARLLVENKIGSLPVVSDSRQLVGVVTRSDLLTLIRS